MYVFNNIANATGHTVDGLAQAVGLDVPTLESLINEFDSHGLDVFLASSKLGLSPVDCLRSIVDLLTGNPHQPSRQHIVCFDDPNIAKMMNTLTTAQKHSIINQAIEDKFSKQSIEAILKTANLVASEGMQYITSGGHVYPGHTLLDHVGVSDATLRDKTSNRKGKGCKTTFPDLATAQNAVNFAIANSTRLQDFIRAAIPHTDDGAIVCSLYKDFGCGYRRNIVDATTIDPPTYFPHVRCVYVWLAVNANGKVFVADAYPKIDNATPSP
jgi:hypothetical protein